MTIDLRALRLDPSVPAFFRWRQVGDNVVLTNLEGNFLILAEDEFKAFAEGRLEEGSPLERRLAAANFLRASYDPRKAA